LLFARAAKDQGIKIVAAAIHKDTAIFLPFLVDKTQWFSVGELKKLFDYFKSQGITQVIMAGQVNPSNLFDKNVKMDPEFQSLFEALQDRKADTIFAAIADKLKANGMELLNSLFLLEKYLAPKGTLTRRGPTLAELADIEFGKTIAKLMGGIDIGQTVVVKGKAIVAIEAMEGTDRCILRGGQIAQEGAVVVKTSKPKQDNRFDVPVVGPRTIQHMIRSRAACLAVEAGKTLIIDQPAVVKLADRHKICIVAA